MSRPDMPDDGTPRPYVSHVDRRTTLAWLGSVSLAAPAIGHAQSPNDRQEKPVVAGAPQPAKGYGTDPQLVKPKPAPWPRLMTQAQLQTSALLCEFILPASADAPSAVSLGVPDFIDEWVSAPYPQQLADRPVVLEGLDRLEADAKRRLGRGLFEASPTDRVAFLTPLTRRPADAAGQAPHAFFRKFRSLVVGAYYTTAPGFKEIGYIGNVPRSVEPGPSPEVRAALDAAFVKLGL